MIIAGAGGDVWYNPSTGVLYYGGTAISYETYDYADFATIDTTYRRYIIINDLHSSTTSSGASGGSRWLVNPLASTPEEKIVLDSGPLWFDTYAAFTSLITLSDHPGLRVHVGNVGSGIPVLVNKYSSTLSAYRLVPENKTCNLFDMSFGTKASPTLSISAAVTSGEFDFGDKLIPGGLVKSVDTFQIRGAFVRRASTATTATSFLVTLNTTNAVNADYVFAHSTGSSGLNPYHVNFDFEFRASGTTTFTTIDSGFTGEHAASAAGHFVDRNTAVNFANDMYLNAFCGAKDTAHTVDLLYLSLDWRANL